MMTISAADMSATSPPTSAERITKAIAPTRVPATLWADLTKDLSTYGCTMATVVNRSHLAFSRSQCLQTKAHIENSRVMRTAKVNLAESVLRISLARTETGTLLGASSSGRSARDIARPTDETADMVSGSAPGFDERSFAISASKDSGVASPEPRSSIRDAIPLRTSGPSSLPHTLRPRHLTATIRSSTERSLAVTRKLDLSLSPSAAPSPLHDASNIDGSGLPPAALRRAASATNEHSEVIPERATLPKRPRLTTTFIATTSTEPTASARSLTGSWSASTGTASMNAYPSRNGKWAGDARSCIVRTTMANTSTRLIARPTYSSVTET